MKNKIILIVIQVVLVLAAAGGTWWFTRPDAPEPVPAEGEEAADAANKPLAKPEYISISPSFVVNLQDTRPMRFLMVEVELMSRQTGAKDTIEEYLPGIQHGLNMLFSAQTQETISTAEDREKLQQASADKVNDLLESEGQERLVDAVYFTKFVVQ
ncbi:flagellar basal body-associated FliL family protein [Spongiibacter sp. KMU-158]|uniref:Flagellar protein FliL n=1 Tax=Spongiibacter pelagi TaxID=2760804 RepID=A0A927GVU0_9GAMM|nr:flagellar basal body-associated FliL family protein [Spongiibacter pelagi]MBD2858438.1 flagellar basal body-associated FliL family protein [Spongiibacter pelagi]